MICKHKNFEKLSHSGEINFSTLKGETLEEILQNIETILKGCSFSMSLDESQEVDNYLDSIKSLIDMILEELGKKELPFTLNRSSKSLIRKHFESKFLPKPLTPVELNIQAVIAGTDLITEDERRSMQLSQTLREVYGDNDAINTFRLSQFDEEMRILTIIDVANRRIIDNVDDLNRGIIKYLSQQFKIIRDFLVQNGFDTKLLPQSLYREDSSTQIPNLVRTYYNALQIMYNLILSKKVNGTLSAELEEGWVAAITGRGDASLHNAVNAYVNLTYFDNILKECFGDYVNINQDFDLPISTTTNDGNTTTIYKYQFEKGNANAAKNWGIENHDSLKEMSKFQLVLIKSIPIYDYETRSIEYGLLLPRDFIGAFSKLLDIGSQVVVDMEFMQAINTFHDYPLSSLEIIFNKLFETRNNKTLLERLEKLGLDQNNINYLYSVYRTVFKGNNSWKSIEHDYITDKGLSSRYFLIDTLLGVMDSNVAMNYVNTTYNHDTAEIETNIKARYSANRTKFDIINNVNSTTIDREDKSDILSRFKIDTTNKKDYTITLNNTGNPITFTIISTKGGLLDKGAHSNALNIQGISNLVNVDIATQDNRYKLISRLGLTTDEGTLMSVLDFIDTMLGTYFSRDVDGLRELSLLLKMKKLNLTEMFASASRVLLVTDIYNNFNNALDSKGEKYSRTELLKFLSDSGIYSDKILEYNDKRKKEYFIKRFDGYQLSSLRGNQVWIEDLAKVRAILSGDTSKSVIANLDGDKIPNFGPGFLGARIEQLLTKSNLAGRATANLLFSQNPTAIKAKVVNTDVITKDGLKKQVKNMTEGELLYDAIVNKFIVPYLDSKSVYTQPTTLSDKTKFILYQVSLEALGLDNISGANFNELVERQIIKTIGLAYKEVWAQVLKDYEKIFPEYAIGGLNLDAVQNWLKTHNEKDFTNRALAVGVTVYKDVHYRQIIGKNLSINELLHEYANFLYTPESLHERLELEKVSFINDLLSKRLSFEVSLTDSGSLDKASGNAVTKLLVDILGSEVGKTWVKGNKLILAKVRGKNGQVKNITYGKISLKEGETFEINPILNTFFMLDNLIGNNLRYSLTGSEINHKVKAVSKLDLGKEGMNLFKDFIQKYNPNYDNGIITFYDAITSLKNFELRGEESDERAAKAIRKIYKEQIYKIENGAQNALFKRNVIIPGTMRYYLQGRLNGIRDRMKVAVINDINANVFNFDGKSDEIDAHDGSAVVNPFSSILENWSLQDCEVGTIKKPIQHWYDDRYMSATLLKYAVDTITNRWMLQAEGNDPRGKLHGIVLRNVFKKMTNIRWHNADGTWKFGPIDLIEGCDYRLNSKIDFFKHILEGKSLYYRDGLDHKKIGDFGVENGVYYTIEYDVDSMGLAPTNKQKVYHYFKNTGEHVKSSTILTLEEEAIFGVHTIDSLFELHTALGGIYSESVDSEGNLQFSEASNYAVALFINNVATLKEGADPDNLTQDSYYQPLKEAMIDVLANNSAVKNGAGNINPTSLFYDDSEFSYMEIGTEGYGIQMDADHTADEGHMTEFSQVISSLDAGGRLHEYVSQIYETLGKLAVDLSQIELDSIQHFRETGNLSKVYDIVGRTIMNNLSKNRGLAGLANAIIDNIKEKFNLNTDHSLDEFKIPFSDPNIYSTILSTFVSVINKKSIKRQYPGLGTVMVPGYNISMIYDVDGKTYLYEDLIRMSINSGFSSEYTDLSMKNRDLVLKFLLAKQNELPIYTNQEVFQPTDNVRISYNSDVSGTGMIEVSLDNIKDYYLFKDDIVAFLNGRGIINPTNITYLKNITVPRNLAPAKISWEYDDATGHHVMNIFDHWAVKNSHNKKRDVKAILKAFDNLEKGIYIDLNGVSHKIQNLLNLAAELIMSNLYKSKFGLRNEDTLADVIDKGVDYFIKPITPIMSSSYDLVYTKQDNRNLYITFKPLQHNDENFDSLRRTWKNKIKKEFSYPPEYTGDKTIINIVYTATNDNIPLFEVGREILRKDVLYDTVKKKFVDQTGKILSNQSRFTRLGEDLVIEYIEFISNNQVTEIREKTSKYDLYNINRSAIKNVLLLMEYTEKELTRIDKKTGTTYTITSEQKFNEEVDGFISNLLADIYHTRDFNGMLVNKEVSIPSAHIIQNTLYRLGENLKYDVDLSSYVKDLLEMVKSGKAEDGVVKYSSRVRTRILNRYHEKLAQKQYASFIKSQLFTVSRIPAQTLLSFMQMRNVGFTGTSNNQCFVSHWLTWLQGSDYDIDKAYIMGLSFDGNGRYVGWSNLFDYSSSETIKASEYLPMPKRKVYNVVDGGFNIDRFIMKIVAADPVSKINGYVELLNYLNSNNITDITYSIPEGKEVVLAIRSHEFTKIPYSLLEDANKNFISSHIQNTVLNLRNMIGAYSPIEMEKFRAASEKSPKGELASKMTLFNPTTKLLMQYQNITGKNVIGIAANGEKASFMWHYYINDILRNPTEEKIKYSLFSFVTTRLKGRDSGNIQTQEVNTLPDINFEGINPELMALYGIQLTGDITVDLMISLILSAATDNAKELILAKVNAGMKLAKMYLFLVTLGYDINDIVKFMTSPAVTFIDAMTETNIFTGQDLSIHDALKLARGDFSLYYKSFLSTRTLGNLTKEEKKKLAKGELIENRYYEGSKEYIELENALSAIAETKYLLQQTIDGAVAAAMKELKGRSEADIREEIINGIPLDLDEFENILEGANEFSNLGKILGVNLGLPTSKELLQKRVLDMQKILSDRIKAVNKTRDKGDLIEDIPLDVKRFLTDAEYAKQIKELYNSVKKCINIFDIIDHIPQFNSIFKIFSTILDIDHNISIKTRAYDSVYDLLKLEGRYMSEQYLKRLLKGIDDAIIAKFINNSGIAIPYTKGINMLNDIRQVIETKEDGLLLFDSLSSVASFKYLFENSIVPNLKRGIIYDYLNGKIVQITDDSLKSNKFILSLIKGESKGVPLYKCDLDMLTIENSLNNKIKFLNYIKGLQALLKIKINGIALSDLFVLYNLVVNKNQYGSDRMTTLFDSFIQSNGLLSLIKKYLNYIGELDYYGKVTELNINIKDLMKLAAAIVNSEVGQSDPTIIVNTDSGPELRIKAGSGYVKEGEIVPAISGESKDKYLERIHNHNSYFVLGGEYSDVVDRLVQNLREINNHTLDTINNLIRQGILTIYKVCQ